MLVCSFYVRVVLNFNNEREKPMETLMLMLALAVTVGIPLLLIRAYANGYMVTTNQAYFEPIQLPAIRDDYKSFNERGLVEKVTDNRLRTLPHEIGWPDGSGLLPQTTT